MPKRQVFYSFHYSNDALRVQQVINMGVIEGNEIASSNDWEEIKRSGDSAIKNWIDSNMNNRSCVIVLVGSETSTREWVKYEIKKAYSEKKGLFGVYIHNLKCPVNGTSRKGNNPFSNFTVGKTSLSELIQCYDPGIDAYNTISSKIGQWIETAIQQAQLR